MAARPSPPPLALTMGEPAGIGGELTLKAWLRRDAGHVAPFLAVDDPDRLAALAARLSLDLPIRIVRDPDEAARVFTHALPVLPCALAHEPVPGVSDRANAPAVLKSIETAVALAQDGRVGAVVTNPIHKQVLNEAGFAFPGHTEYLAHLTGISSPPVMMLACSKLRVVPVTIHVSLADAARTLTTRAIVEQGRITAEALRRDFAIAAPRLAVAGLNPHAGEGGHMGREDIEIVAPAVAELRRLGIDARGPLPADTMFHDRARAGYDVAICMYHDQALIPIKTLGFDEGVNITLGLPIVRTSPDHGTALDIAGSGEARSDSLVAAIATAALMTAARARA